MATSTKKSGTLSASEALKAAEAAIGTGAPKPRAKAAPAKVAPAKAAAAAKPPVARAKPAPKAHPAPPAAIMAASMAVDAAPEPLDETIAAALPPETTPVEPVAEAVIADPAPMPLIEGNSMMNDVMETGKKFAEDAKAKMETAYAGFNEKAKAGVEKSTKAIGEMSDLAKGNVEALVESGKIAAKGFETMGQEAVDYSRKNIEKAQATIKSFSGVKTPTEFFQLQSALLSSSFDEFTKEAAKSSEAMMKLAGDIAAPLTARATIVTDKVKALAA